MLPAEGMMPVREMDIEEVWDKLRKGIHKMSKKHRGWAFNLNRILKAGGKPEAWLDEWARTSLIEMRSPDIGPMIDEDDNAEGREMAINRAEF